MIDEAHMMSRATRIVLAPVEAVMWMRLAAAFRVVDWLDERGEQR